jgi:Transcriptional regulatory protein, C terminal
LHHGLARLFPNKKLLNTVWADSFVTEDVLARSISELRRAFDDKPRQPRFIETIPKRGYRLVALVEPADGAHKTTPLVRRPVRGKWFSATAALVALLIFCVLIFRGNSSTDWLPRVATASSFPVQVEAHTQDPADVGKDRSPDPAPKVVKKGTPKVTHADPVLKESPVTVVTVLNNTNVSQSEGTVASRPDVKRLGNTGGGDLGNL